MIKRSTFFSDIVLCKNTYLIYLLFNLHNCTQIKLYWHLEQILKNKASRAI